MVVRCVSGFFVFGLMAFTTVMVSSPSQADTPAISPPVTKPCQLTMTASSQTEKLRWGIYVQQVETTSGTVIPKALVGYFPFGRADNPMSYPPQTSSVAPIVGAANYKIAVYFYDNRDGNLQPHSVRNNLSNGGWDLKLNPDGSPKQMTATFWDRDPQQAGERNGDLSAQIHKVVIDFACP